MRLGGVFGALALAGGCLVGSAASAADWQIATVSGKAYRLVGSDWVKVSANDAFSLGDTVKTLGSGTLTLVRDGVTVTVAPNSQVQIKERMNGKFTDVLQTEGSAAVEVDPQKHIRLAVETPYMAAVVKGTVFSVSTFKGYSETAVQRGRVAVIDVKNRLETDVTAGQKATSGEGKPLTVAGPGKLMKPQTFKGKVVTQQADGTLVESKSEVPETQTINGAGKTVTSHAGGKSDGAGKSEDSKAGGNAGGNSGKGNSGGDSGKGNSGNGNSGNGNSGNGNSNSGSGNSGHGNSGNSGHGNSGNGNSGNSGHGNSGNGNSGNSGHGSSGNSGHGGRG